ncbi:hypothetical protein Tco_1545208, partial [Tanacetum coccineum]
MAVGYQNPFYLKQAQQKEHSLYNGKVLLDKHDPLVVYDSEETLQLAQESHLKMKQLNKEIKPVNYATINKLSEVLFLKRPSHEKRCIFQTLPKWQNVSNTISKPISIADDDFLDDTSPSVARKFLNELGDLKGQNMNIQCASNTLNSSSQKLDDENVSLEFQVMSLEKENEHLKAIYQNLFDSIKQTHAQTKIKTDSLQEKLNDMIYENAKLREQLHTKSFEQNNTVKGTSVNTKFAKPSILGKPPLQPFINQSVVRQPTAFQSERPKSSKTWFIPKVVETID